MKSRVLITIIAILVGLILLAGTFSTGYIVARVLPPKESTQAVSILEELNLPQAQQTDPAAAGTPEDLQKLFEPFWQAWDLVHDQYVDQPIDDEQLMRGAIKGMLDSLGDPHTSYLDPDQQEMLNTQLQGEEQYEGIGAWVDITSDFLTVISPMPKSPAEKAGLKSGDQIIAIDGEDMTGLDGEVVQKKVLGPAGSTIKLTILREGQEPFDVSITRASISVPSLESHMLEEDIAYIHLYIFGDKTADELNKVLVDLLAENPKGIILDLRYNGGGYLQSAIQVASEFIDEGVLMYEEYGDGERKPFEARSDGVATNIPLVVLINQGSASASEIVAGAIQDRDRGVLVGVTSFGKGSVQIPTQLEQGQGAVRITVARWLTPDGRTIHETGLTPDYEVVVSDEDQTAGRDPQLDKAVQILLEMK